MKRIVFIYFTATLFISCTDNSNVRYYSVDKEIDNSQLENTSVASNNNVGLDYVIPDGWVSSSGSSMRLASYNIPFDGGVGDLSIIRLGGQAGGDLANVNRWRDQLGLPNIDEITLREMENIETGYATDYKWYKIINESEPTASFLCAIIQEKSTTLFVKLNIPISAIKEVQKQFLSFCSSIKTTQ